MSFFHHLKLYILLYELYMCIIYYYNINFINIYISSETPVFRSTSVPLGFPEISLWSLRAQGLPAAAHLQKPWSPVLPMCTSTQGIPVNLQPFFSFPLWKVEFISLQVTVQSCGCYFKLDFIRALWWSSLHISQERILFLTRSLRQISVQVPPFQNPS